MSGPRVYSSNLVNLLLPKNGILCEAEKGKVFPV